MAHAEEKTAVDVLPITESRLRSVCLSLWVWLWVWLWGCVGVCALRMSEAIVKYSLAHSRVLLYFLRVMSFMCT